MTTPQLTTKQISFLRSRAHPLEPGIVLGKQGPTEAFRERLDAALEADELVKLRVGRRVEVDLAALATGLGGVLVQKVGRVVTIYRPASEPIIRLP